MSAGPLQRLVEAACALPGEKAYQPRRWPVRMEPAPEAPIDAATTVIDIPTLRRRVGELLSELARRVEPALDGALRRAESEWDQVDALTVLDAGLASTMARLRRDAEALRASGEPARAATGLEVLLTVGAAGDLVALLERRLATLVRIRLRHADRELLPDGRPFLDLAAALEEAARGWA